MVVYEQRPGRTYRTPRPAREAPAWEAFLPEELMDDESRGLHQYLWTRSLSPVRPAKGTKRMQGLWGVLCAVYGCYGDA